MNDALRDKARLFAQRWRNRGDEDSDTQQYWIDLLTNVLDVEDAASDPDVCRFEKRTAARGKADVLMAKARVLVEQKSLGIDLDKPEPRQGELKTPVKQAWDYMTALPPSLRPATLITCAFDRFRLYDLETAPLADKGPQSEFTLTELPDHIHELERLFGEAHSRVAHERRISVEAGRLAAGLHDALAACWPDPDAPGAHEALALLTMRVIFCLYAEDANLFRRNLFHDWVKASDARHLRGDLAELFDVLDTPREKRSAHLDPMLSLFPYVDGGLFNERIDPPMLSDDVHTALLDLSEGFDWSLISPVVFGSLMEETLSHDQRRKGGMHYTSVENIHKVIDPLFLDGLRDDLAEAESKPVAGGARTKALHALHDRIAGLRFLDPACGSGNFLTETFLCLRRLENRILMDLKDDGQPLLDLGDDLNPVKVSIGMMHGIEINGFACAVARTALWIAEQQALDDTESIISGLPRLPFKDSGHVIQSNALRLDWNTVLPGGECDYVMGNPPFVGHKKRTESIREDMCIVFDGKVDGSIDYVTCWFVKTARYLTKPGAMFAFVATNSIAQGAPAPVLDRILRDGLHWEPWFAYRSTPWDSQSTTVAAVSVIIAGYRRIGTRGPRILYTSEPTAAGNINEYLIDAPVLHIERRSKPLADLPAMRFGCMPIDGGALLLDAGERETVMRDPTAARYVRPFAGAVEIIEGHGKWCLWLRDAEPHDLRTSRTLADRVECVRGFRLASRRKETRELAATPWLFGYDSQPMEPYLAVPCHFLADRTYMTCARFTPDVICSNACFSCPDPDGFAFAVIESRMFMVWQRTVGGYIGDAGCRFSNTVVWNNLPLPRLDDDVRGRLIAAGRGVLAARDAHPSQCLADLYDPMLMPLDLRRAHEALDRIVDVAFGADAWLGDDDDARLKILFDGYATMTRIRMGDPTGGTGCGSPDDGGRR
ncbi:DNA methyltransferase [Bifidobacterium felsineum]|uniref:DNA methyltransferase n=1 Tax=Bifidobacterium felsineum TaxID=2045440 RepID=UPI001F0A52D6|nr:DNA methyltransferase [Bifidobacterium felsineum]